MVCEIQITQFTPSVHQLYTGILVWKLHSSNNDTKNLSLKWTNLFNELTCRFCAALLKRIQGLLTDEENTDPWSKGMALIDGSLTNDGKCKSPDSCNWRLDLFLLHGGISKLLYVGYLSMLVIWTKNSSNLLITYTHQTPLFSFNFLSIISNIFFLSSSVASPAISSNRFS